jgi:mono/diheme cytochrome c family protein
MLMVVDLGILLSGIALSVWAARRTWRLKSRFLSWSVTGLTCVCAAVCAAASVFEISGIIKLNHRSAPIPHLKVDMTPDRIQRGSVIVNTFCTDCHTKTGPLTGGMDLAEHLALPVGSFITANLTPGGVLRAWSDGEIFRAIRNSLDREGHWLTIMSYTNASRMSDVDIEAVIAYLRSLPAAGSATPNSPDRFNMLGLVMLGSGLLPTGKPVFNGMITSPPPTVSAAYGHYMLSYYDCTQCHGQNLTGGTPGQLAPIGPDLNLVRAWTREQFITTLRTGIDPRGHVINDDMPWRSFGQLSDDDLTAVYRYMTRSPAPEVAATR